MFVDDAKMYLRITDDVGVAQLQQAVDALINWANRPIWQLSISVNKCCVRNVDRVISNVNVNINGAILLAVEHTRDLGVVVSSDLSPSLHVSEIAGKAHKCAALIHKTFVCRDANILLRAYLVYVRPLLEFNSVIWSSHTVKNITASAVQSVQRRFTKRLPGFNTICYRDRLQRLSIPSLELRRLQADLVWCYKIVFGMVNLNFNEFFEWSPHHGTRSHKYKLYKKSPSTQIRSEFFSERVAIVWNELSDSIAFSTITRFKGSILNADFSD